MKKPDFFNKAVSEKLGERLKQQLPNHNPFDVVKLVNRFFWREGVRKNISKAEHRSIFVKNLGTFTVKRKVLYSEIADMIWRIRRIRKAKRYKERTRNIIETQLIENLRNLLALRNEIAIERYNKYDVKNNRTFKTSTESTKES